MKKDAYYFSHDYNAANDVKCLFLRQQLGMEGYGIFWYLIESLATAGGVLPLKIVPVLAMQMQVTETKVNGVIQNFDLFTIVENQFFSNRLNEHLNLRKTLSDEGKKGALLRWGNRGANGGAISAPNRGGNAKERKGKENKENNSTPPATKYEFSHNGFFDRQLEANKNADEIGKYRKLVEHLHSKDDEGKDRFPNILSLPKQISFKDYLALKDTERQSTRTLKEVLEAMENKARLKKEYKSVYLTSNSWLKMEFKPEK